MPYTHVRGLRYYYQCAGAGAPLILLHGFTGSSVSWKTHMESFAGCYLTVAIDLIGHGRTESPADVRRYIMDNAANDVVTLVTQLTPGPVNLIGYSMGGRLALHLALAHPDFVSALILESASPGLPSLEERQARVRADTRLARSIMQDGVAAFVQEWERLPIFANQEQLAAPARTELRRLRLQNNPVGLSNSLLGMGTGAQESLWPKLPGLKPPVLLLTGEYDHKFVALAKEMESVLPRARVAVVPGAGHTIHLERPEQFARLVTRFLREQE